MTAPKKIPESQHCRICGYPLDGKNRTGLCSNRTPACRIAREQLTAEQKPGKFRIVIKAGDTFGRWTALEDYDRKSLTVLCRCECGRRRRIKGYQLTNGHTHGCLSCGQKNRQQSPKDLYLAAGSISGRLTALEDAYYASDRILCRCCCEHRTEVKIRAASVKLGLTKSCGCLHREAITKHGLSKHPLYMIWKGAVLRCENPKGQSYEGYGGRGITVCAGWRDDVRAFIEDIEREIGPRPEGKHDNGRAFYELDRTNNDGGYWCGHCPDCISRGVTMNVRWSDRETQMENRRKVRDLSKDNRRLAGERDALAVRLAEVEAELASRRKRRAPEPPPDEITLF